MGVEAFAGALQRVRRQAGLTYRELAGHAHYSHAHLVRASSGRQLPSWDVTTASRVDTFWRDTVAFGKNAGAWAMTWSP